MNGIAIMDHFLYLHKLVYSGEDGLVHADTNMKHTLSLLRKARGYFLSNSLLVVSSASHFNINIQR